MIGCHDNGTDIIQRMRVEADHATDRLPDTGWAWEGTNAG